MPTVSLAADFKAARAAMSRVAREQLPFATAQALTKLAWLVRDGETEALESTFDRPSPFTRLAFGVRPARKSSPTALVFARDIQAAYLEPYEFSGFTALGKKRAILTPKNVRLNQYGNLARNKIATLKGQPRVFTGSITFKKSGETVSGVWQRPKVGERRTRQGGTVGQGLKLLVRFTDPQSIAPRGRAQVLLRKNFSRVLDQEMAAALATAR